MQFYGQDVLASKASEKADPFDFSVDPDVTKGGLPVASNFFFYNKVCNFMYSNSRLLITRPPLSCHSF